MSRSRRKKPITGVTTASSEKEDKKLWHRVFRRKNKQLLNAGEEPLDIKDVSNPWDMDKDGKVYHDDWEGAYRK